MKTVYVVIAALLVSCALWAHGYSQGRKSVKLEDLQEYKDTVTARNKLEVELADKDIALMATQQQLAEARDEKVIQYVTVYKDRIKDPAVAQCMRDSGLLDVYDATVSPAIK